MDYAKMNQKNLTAVPIPFRSLRVLLLDNDRASLLDIASKLENYSYRVTAIELPTIALSILQERAERFDVVMADINMPEMECFKFIKSVQLIKDFPIILMSAELKKEMVEEAITKGACFFLRKPISSKNLKNVWQHAYRKTNSENCRAGKAETRTNDNQEAESDRGAKVEEKENVQEIVDGRTSLEQVGDSDENDLDDLLDRRTLIKLTGICKKRSLSQENDEAVELKRKRTEDEGNKSLGTDRSLSGRLGDFHKQLDGNLELDKNQEFTDSSNSATNFLKLLQETNTITGPNFCEGSPFQSKFLTGMGGANQKLDMVTELASSSYPLKQEQLNPCKDEN